MGCRNSPGKKRGQIAVAISLSLVALVALAACGGTTGSAVSQPAATVAALQVQPEATQTPAMQATATADPSMDDMTSTPGGIAVGNTPTTAQVVPTQDTSGAADAAATPAPTSSGEGASTGTEVQATLKEWAIELSQSEVPASKITFTVTNAGQVMHNLTVEDDSGVIGQTPAFSARQGTQTLVVGLQPGTYTLFCSLPGHAQQGQKTALVVR